MVFTSQRLLILAMVFGLMLPAWGAVLLAQQPLPPAPPAPGSAEASAEVLLRGPVHEAFAEQINLDPRPGIVVSTQPPEPIEEIPPEIRPAGEHVVWIPGYWGWDHQRDDFIWISGVWRTPPPGYRWVPGYWTDVAEGYQWISGFWLPVDVSELHYLPYPPQSLEVGPAGAAPSANHFWVSGCWLYRSGRYQWRPGYWTIGYADWMWVPDHYVWTPSGAIYVRGRWDYRVDDRGMLFAPVYFRGDVSSRTSLRFAPTVVIDAQRMLLHLFVRPDVGHYYFGDYYGPQFASAGFLPTYEFHDGRRRYDPIFAFYRWDYGRRGIDYAERLSGWHRYFETNEDLRPPHSLKARSNFVARHKQHAQLDQALLGHTVDEILAKPDRGPRVVRLGDAQRETIGRTVDGLRDLVGQRSQVEAGAPAQGRADGRGAVKLPRSPLKIPEAVDIAPRDLAPELPDVLRQGKRNGSRSRGGVVPERRRLPERPRIPNVPRQIPKQLPIPQAPKLPNLPGLP